MATHSLGLCYEGTAGGMLFCISNPMACSDHTHSFVYSFGRYLLSTYHAPGIAPVLRTAANKEKGPSPEGAEIPVGREGMNR